MAKHAVRYEISDDMPYGRCVEVYVDNTLVHREVNGLPWGDTLRRAQHLKREWEKRIQRYRAEGHLAQIEAMRNDKQSD